MRQKTRPEKKWRTSMIAISPKKLAATDDETKAWVAKRKTLIAQAMAYSPKASRQNRRKRTQIGA